MIDQDLLTITEEDLNVLPASALRIIILRLVDLTIQQEKRIKELETRLNQSSSNSNKPPSTDSPYKEKKTNGNKNKPGGRKGHKGHRQQFMTPTKSESVHPKQCSCGCRTFRDLQPYYTHQHIELPEIIMTVIHFILYEGTCTACGKISKGHIPAGFSAGFGPRFSALVAELGGIDGNSRETIQSFCSSVLGVKLSLGVIQKIIDRASAAITPHYEAIKNKARSARVNHLDETTLKSAGKLHWLWVMANRAVAFFMVHRNRSQAAFAELIGAWEGILVSDGYRLYQNWIHLRQTCLAHLIRRAKGLAERSDPELAKCGAWTRDELRKLCKMAKDPPTMGEWHACYARLCRLITLYGDSKSEAGKFVRHIEREMDSLFTFLIEKGVDPTNNFGERMLRYAVLWRKRSQGTSSEKGNRWVERIVSLRQTCRLQGKSSYAVLVEAMDSFFKNQQPDLEWIRSAT